VDLAVHIVDGIEVHISIVDGRNEYGTYSSLSRYFVDGRKEYDTYSSLSRYFGPKFYVQLIGVFYR
jgi:hypothetical protein